MKHDQSDQEQKRANEESLQPMAKMALWLHGFYFFGHCSFHARKLGSWQAATGLATIYQDKPELTG
jgi:hypothetical protein